MLIPATAHRHLPCVCDRRHTPRSLVYGNAKVPWVGHSNPLRAYTIGSHEFGQDGVRTGGRAPARSMRLGRERERLTDGYFAAHVHLCARNQLKTGNPCASTE